MASEDYSELQVNWNSVRMRMIIPTFEYLINL